ncbi:MAG TPA: hypothetical protein VK732_05415 [Verrucomicrobiae bacterium]|nr:hypothetical protein [Verrucomicrobiae bacterium]
MRGHAAAGEDPGLGVTVGDAVAVTLGRVVAVADDEGAVVGETEREADGTAVAVGEVRVCASGPHALTTTMPMARASAP